MYYGAYQLRLLYLYIYWTLAEKKKGEFLTHAVLKYTVRASTQRTVWQRGVWFSLCTYSFVGVKKIFFSRECTLFYLL